MTAAVVKMPPTHISDLGPNMAKRKLMFERLPIPAQAKLRRIEDVTVMRNGEWSANQERRRKNREGRAEIHRIFYLFERDVQAGMRPTEANKAEQEARKKDIERLDEEYARLCNFKLPPTMTDSYLWEWLGELPTLRVRKDGEGWGDPNHEYIPAEHEILYCDFREASVPLPAKKAPADALAEARANIGKISETKRAASRASIPLSEAEASIIADIDRAAGKGLNVGSALRRHVRLNGRVERGRMIWPTRRIMTANGMSDVPDGFALLVWLNRDELKKRALEALRAAHDPKNALSDEDRAARLAELDAELLAQERIEEAAVEACEAAGIRVYRRPNADPRAVLGVEVIPPADPEADFG